MFGRHRLGIALLTSVFLGGLGCSTLKGGAEYGQALQAFKSHQYEIAEGHLTLALKKNPGNERATSLLGWVRFKQGRIEEALRLFAEAYERNSENAGTVEGLGWTYYLNGQDEHAEREFETLIKFTVKHLQNPNWQYYETNDRAFIQSIHSDANYALGLIAQRRGMLAVARRHFEEAMRLPNQFIDREIIARELADTLFRLGEYEAAGILYKEFLSKNSEDLACLNRYAWCLYQTGSMKEAKHLFLRSKELSLFNSGSYQESLGSQSVTQRIYAKRMAEPYYGLALIYEKEGRLVAAKGELATALKISPYFHHPKEITLLLDQYPEWQEMLRLRSLGRSLP